MATEIASNVYEIELPSTEESYRAHLFDGEFSTLVDTGSADTVGTLIDELEKLDITPDRVLLTHADFDHAGGFDAIVDRYNPETWVPKQSTLDTTHEPDNRFEHGDIVWDFVAVHVPGHTTDNYAFINEDIGLAVLGDVLIGADRRGLPVGYFVLPEAIYSNDLIAAERYLERLLAYDFDVGLVSHGSSVQNGAREKIEEYVEFPAKPEWD